MRKQTKLVAVLSTAALLAVGASMTSFAATGWQEENGSWVYYDRSGDLETEKWEKSGDHWFYLNEDGEMTTDAVVEYRDNFYYVDENGAMSTNRWVSVENEDSGDEYEPTNYWYYFQSNGKAIKGSDNHVSIKNINGKRYTFNEDGKMLYGWVDEDGERVTGDDAWQTGRYYFGSENDGAMSVGWLELDIVDENATEDDEDTAFDDEDQTRWFYFQSNGKKLKEKDGKTINGVKYGFDDYGRMIAEWRQNGEKASPAVTATQATPNTADKAAESNQWRYYGTPESGARVTKGWFQVVPAKGLNEDDYNDDSDNWYYSNKDGQLLTNEIKTINGKKYAFDESGAMVTGLKFVSVLKSDKKVIVAIHDDDYYDTEEEFEDFANGGDSSADEVTPNFFWNDDKDTEYVTYCYYFDGDDGDMNTGKTKVDIDGETYEFSFNKSGGKKGVGKMEEDHDKYYLSGKLLKAEKDDRYSVLRIETKKGSSAITGIKLLTTDEFVGNLGAELDEDVDDVEVNGMKITHKKGNSYYEFNEDDDEVIYRLVSTSGKVVTNNKSKAKDGNDICYQVKKGKIVAVFEED